MDSIATTQTLYWSFVNSAGSQSQLTETLAGISITAMVLVLSPLFLGPRTERLGVERRDEISDLFKFLLIAFTSLVTASMLWGQLNGYGQIEGKAWEQGAPNAMMIPLHVLFLSCSSLTTIGVVALAVALLELVLLSMARPAGLTKLVLMMYAVIVTMASLQVLFGSSLVLAEIDGRGIDDQQAIDNAMFAVPVVLVIGAAPAVRSLWRRKTRSASAGAANGPSASVRRTETALLLVGGLLSVLAVQLAPEITTDPTEFDVSRPGLILSLAGAAATLLYVCLMWWALWNVTDRLSVDATRLASDELLDPVEDDSHPVAPPALAEPGSLEVLLPSPLPTPRPVLRTGMGRRRPVRRHSMALDRAGSTRGRRAVAPRPR